jgi:hypothetical protein
MLKHGKSKKAFEHNVKTEIESGKPQDQALAIAYSVKRKAGPKKMAQGGLMDRVGQTLDDAADRITGEGKYRRSSDGISQPEQSAPKGTIKRNPMTDEIPNRYGYAEGGEVEHFDSVAEAIRHKMKMKKMAEGGMVDIEENNEEQPNAYYHADEAALKENYDQDFEDMTQPHDSNLQSDEIEHDKHDMISAIRHKMKKMR